MNSFDSIATSCEDKIRSRPLPCAGTALAAGFVLSRLPLLAITGLVVRILLLLIRPALLFLGGAKVWDSIRSRREEVSQAAPEIRF